MAEGLSITIVNTLNSDKTSHISVLPTDSQEVLYQKAAEAEGLKPDGFTLEYQGKALEKNDKPISDTELEDSCELHVTLSVPEKAKLKLKQMNKEPTITCLCEAAADNDTEVVALCIDAGVDVNGRYTG